MWLQGGGAHRWNCGAKGDRTGFVRVAVKTVQLHRGSADSLMNPVMSTRPWVEPLREGVCKEGQGQRSHKT